MKSNLQAVDIVFSHLKGSVLDMAITGQIMKHRRIANSTKEDVVINSLALNNTQLQRGILNVNIHVPNLSIPTEQTGVRDNGYPNSVRLNQLTDLAIPILKDTWGADYDFDIEQINLITEETSSFNNIRITFQALNV